MTTGTQFPWDGAGSEPRGKTNKTSKPAKAPKAKARKPRMESNGLLASLNDAAAKKKRSGRPAGPISKPSRGSSY